VGIEGAEDTEGSDVVELEVAATVGFVAFSGNLLVQ
jgi:hypothetical protein